MAEKQTEQVAEPIDATNELMNGIVEEEVEQMQNIRPIEELLQVPYNELTETEKQFLITGLAVKNTELDELINRTKKHNQRVIDLFNKEINKIEDTFQFIRDLNKQHYMTVELVIKNLEREVRENGN